MKIILTSIGTRGDIEPFLAIGIILKEKGHQVICAFSEKFREVTESCDIEFASLGRKNDDVLESDVKAMPIEQLWEGLELRNSLPISN
jgi:UDP:flavonoid glycosyltransferase YjiC (YdhE family)